MPLITSEIAREFQRRGVESRRARAATPKLTEPTQCLDPTITDDFTSRRLARVRKQLERIDAMLETEDDPQRMDRLAAASMRLSDQEFALADRPKPGNRRPPANKPGPKGGVFWGGTAAPAPSAPPSSQSQQAEPETPDSVQQP